MASRKTLIFVTSFMFFMFLITLEGRNAAGNNAGLASDKEALLAFKAAVGRSLNWNENTSPCTWVGIHCVDRVTELRLPGADLTGEIPEGILGRLRGLVALSLRSNRLSGEIPLDLGNCSLLRGLFLQHNSFSGPLQPSIVTKLPNLERLNLAFNRFSGTIPDSVANLSRLKTLKLQNNSFTGCLPVSATNFSDLLKFNVSNNRLNGSIPLALRYFPKSSFLGNIDLCGWPMVPCPGESDSRGDFKSVQSSSGKKLSANAIVGIVSGTLAFVLILFSAIYAFNKLHKSVTQDEFDKNHQQTEQEQSFVVFDGPDKQNYSSLTQFFSSSAMDLGQGSMGRVFKAVIASGQILVVKELNDLNVEHKEFAEHMQEIASMAHSNLVTLRGYYYSKNKKLLVYDHISKGSLWNILHGSDVLLDWTARLKIALGVSKAVQFIHSKGRNYAHGNIKSSNVLINQQGEAFLSDFGLLQLARRTLAANCMMGYRAPEVTDPQKVSHKADVYSLGVLLLELVTRKMPSDGKELMVSNKAGVDLPKWVAFQVRTYWTTEVFDLQLQGVDRNLDDMISLLKIALRSTEQFPEQRPSVNEIVAVIEALKRESLQMEYL